MNTNEFKMNTYAYKPVEAFGSHAYHCEKFEVNYSSVLSQLIQEAGRFCEYYASDLFILWSSVVEYIDTVRQNAEKTFLFGFRQMGVDGNSFVLSCYENAWNHDAKYNYRSMWRLDVVTDGNEIKLTLGRVF